MFNKHIRKALPMIMLAILFLWFMSARPFAEPLQSILQILYLGALLGITVLDGLRQSREADEVELATTNFSVLTGALFGLLGAIVLLIAIAHVPIIAEFIAGFATNANNKLPAAAAGFVLGIATTLVLVLISIYIAYAVRSRWLARL